MSERYTHIPDVYEETLERKATDISELPYFGIETFEEKINRAYHRAEACGCGSCKARFWRAVEEAVESESRHIGDEDIMAAIEKYAPLIDDTAEIDDCEFDDDDDWMNDTGDL